jgi:hypothetical protein
MESDLYQKYSLDQNKIAEKIQDLLSKLEMIVC